MECKLGCVNFRRLSDRRREFRPAIRVTEICDDRYRSTMGVIVISSGTPWSAGENFGCTWEHLGVPARSQGAPATCLGAPTTSLIVPATSLGAAATSLGAPTTSLGALATSLEAPQITVEQSEKNVLFGNAASAPGNHSYYLSFNDC